VTLTLTFNGLPGDICSEIEVVINVIVSARRP
jgi:hypothetical protein